MSERCAKCNVLFDKNTDRSSVSVCSECLGHFHATCCSTKAWNLWAKRNARREEWKCDTCKSESLSTNSKSDNEASGNSTVLSVLGSMRKEIADNHKDTKTRFDALDQTLNTLKATVEESQRKIQSLEDHNAELNEKLLSCQSQLDKNNSEMDKMRFELLELQQYSRRHNIEIKGIPMTSGENVYAILERVAGALGVRWSYGDISIAHRLRRPESGHPAIVAAFVCRVTKDEWLSAAKAKKLTTTDLANSLPPGPVYVNSHLAPHNKQLLGRARQLVRDRKLANAWTVDGKVMVRKNAGGRGIRVVRMEDFEGIAEG